MCAHRVLGINCSCLPSPSRIHILLTFKKGESVKGRDGMSVPTSHESYITHNMVYSPKRKGVNRTREWLSDPSRPQNDKRSCWRPHTTTQHHHSHHWSFLCVPIPRRPFPKGLLINNVTACHAHAKHLLLCPLLIVYCPQHKREKETGRDGQRVRGGEGGGGATPAFLCIGGDGGMGGGGAWRHK